MIRKACCLVCVVAALSLLGCAHTAYVWRPGQAPPIPLETVGPFPPGMSVHLINGALPGETQHANHVEWTELFIRTWTGELTKRGVTVGPESGNKISVRLDDIRRFKGFARLRTDMKVHLSGSDNTWKKDYSETAESGRGWADASANLFQHTVEKLMKDPEVMGRMKP